MVENKITIPYQIKGIKPCDKKEGYVEVLMEPIDKLEYNGNERSSDIPIKITDWPVYGMEKACLHAQRGWH